MSLVVVDKNTGVAHETSGNTVTLNSASIVKLAKKPSLLQMHQRNGDNLVLHFSDGTVVTVKGFFKFQTDLVLDDGAGKQWLVTLGSSLTEFSFDQVELEQEAAGESAGGLAPILLGLAGVGALGGILASQSSNSENDLLPDEDGDSDGDGNAGDGDSDGDGNAGDGDSDGDGNAGDGDSDGDGNAGDGDSDGDGNAGDGDSDGDGNAGDGDSDGDGNAGDGDSDGDGNAGDGDSDGDGNAGDGDGDGNGNPEDPTDEALQAYDDVVNALVSLKPTSETRVDTQHKSSILNVGFVKNVYEFEVPEGATSDVSFDLFARTTSGFLNNANATLEVFSNGTWVALKNVNVTDIFGGANAKLEMKGLEAGQYRLNYGGGCITSKWAKLELTATVTETSLVDFEANGVSVEGSIFDGSASAGGNADVFPKDGQTQLKIDIDGSGNFVDVNDKIIVQGEYGYLTISADGSYSYQFGTPGNPSVDASSVGKVDSFSYKLVHPDHGETTANVHVQIGSNQTDLVWDENDPSNSAGSVVANDDTNSASIHATNIVENYKDNSAIKFGWGLKFFGKEQGIANFTVADNTVDSVSLYLKTTNPLCVNLQVVDANTGEVVKNINSILQMKLNGTTYHTEISGLTPGDYKVVMTNKNLILPGKTQVDIEHTVTHFDQWMAEKVSSANGNVLADDDLASSLTTLSVLTTNGKFELPDADGVIVEGKYGTLTMFADGNYTYTPKPNLNFAGNSDVFTYKITGPNGQYSTADLVIDIASTGMPTGKVLAVDSEIGGESEVSSDSFRSFNDTGDQHPSDVAELDARNIEVETVAEPASIDFDIPLYEQSNDIIDAYTGKNEFSNLDDSYNQLDVAREDSLDYLVPMGTDQDDDLVTKHVV